MKVKKKIISCILAAAMLINVYTGCGDSKEIFIRLNGNLLVIRENLRYTNMI